MQNLLVVCGPTATGKTRLAIDLAQQMNGEIVCADSMQIYTGMDIGTAKPTAYERGLAAHHMLDMAPPWQPYSVARYQLEAAQAIEDITGRGKLPILCGGTGLYIQALLYGYAQGNTPPDAAFRAQMAAYADAHGPLALHALLAQDNAATAQRIHPNNVRRVIRALEIAQNAPDSVPDAMPQDNLRYNACILALGMERTVLNARIDARVDQMMAQGLLDEVRAVQVDLAAHGATATQAIGYKELAAHLRGECTLEAAVAQVKQETRRYAKRQMTWFKRMQGVHWLDAGASEQALFDSALSTAEAYFGGV